jgi:hypothetical protein
MSGRHGGSCQTLRSFFLRHDLSYRTHRRGILHEPFYLTTRNSVQWSREYSLSRKIFVGGKYKNYRETILVRVSFDIIGSVTNLYIGYLNAYSTSALRKLCILSRDRICVFRLVLTINSDCLSKQHQPVGLCSGTIMCFLWGTDCICVFRMVLAVSSD